VLGEFDATRLPRQIVTNLELTTTPTPPHADAEVVPALAKVDMGGAGELYTYLDEDHDESVSRPAGPAVDHDGVETDRHNADGSGPLALRDRRGVAEAGDQRE
jgi:hypothetical protein